MAIKICRRTGKEGYRSAKEAEATLRRIEQQPVSLARYYERQKREVSVYRCPHCPRWHLSSQRQLPGSNGVNLR